MRFDGRVTEDTERARGATQRARRAPAAPKDEGRGDAGEADVVAGCDWVVVFMM